MITESGRQDFTIKISACVAVNALLEMQGKRSSLAQLMAFEVTVMLQAS
jgi:hypothetical protein